MRQGRASRTAEHNALFRALETALPEGRRLFEDRLARSFLSREFDLVVRLGAVPGLRELVLAYIDRRWPGVRSSLVARTRLIDDVIVAALREPPEQLVILGAGFDTRAVRLPGARAVRVFEVDHPDTQASKRRTLERVLGAPPDHVRFVSTNFHAGDLAAAMDAAGYRASARGVILWEGVTNYLDAAAVDATLRWCAQAAPGSLLIFTYIHRDVLEKPEAFFGTRRLFASLAKVGERFTFGLDPNALAVYLAERGLALERDLGAAEYRRLYLGAAADRIRGYEFYHVAIARVTRST